MTTPEYREKINAELPDYRAVASIRINKGDRILINSHPLEYDTLLAEMHNVYRARAELRRRHRQEWRLILSQIPGTVQDVRLGLTPDKMREWPW